MASHNIQTKRDFVKVLQYVGEGDTVTTPASFGVTPTDPTFTAVGKVTDINLQPDIQHSDTDVLGNEDVIDAIKTQENYSFSISFGMTDTTLINYAFSASGGAINILHCARRAGWMDRRTTGFGYRVDFLWDK